MKNISLRKALAVPTVLTLTLGGVLIATIPANADPADLTAPSHVVNGNTLTVTGKGTVGDTVQLQNSVSQNIDRHNIGADGSYSFTYTIPADLVGSQTYTVLQEKSGFAEDGSQSFTAAAVPVVSNALTLGTPAAGTTTDSRTVTFSGTAPINSSIKVLDANGAVIGSSIGSTTSTDYSFPVTFADDAAVSQTVTVTSQAGGRGADNTVTRSFNLPAVAPSNALTLTTPAAGTTTDSRTVTFSGTAPINSSIKVLDSNGAIIGSSNGSTTSTDYSFPVTFADDAAAAQTVTVTSQAGGKGADNTVTRSFNLPVTAPVGDNTLTLDTPAEGSTTASRTVTFTGTAPATSIVTVTDADGVAHRTDGSITGTTYSIDVTYADDAAAAQTVTVSSFAGGRGADNTVTRSFTLPVTAPTQIATPVITSPKDGAKLTGKSVTFTGTGTPGADIALAIVPTDEIQSADTSAVQEKAVAPQATAAAADPTADVITATGTVGTNGTFSIAVPLTPNDYTAEAISTLGTGDDVVVSDPSNLVEFTLAAAAVTSPAGTGTTTTTGANGTSDPNGSLAFTGSNTAPVAGLAGLLLAAGAALTFVARRRRSLLGR